MNMILGNNALMTTTYICHGCIVVLLLSVISMFSFGKFSYSCWNGCGKPHM